MISNRESNTNNRVIQPEQEQKPEPPQQVLRIGARVLTLQELSDLDPMELETDVLMLNDVPVEMEQMCELLELADQLTQEEQFFASFIQRRI